MTAIFKKKYITFILAVAVLLSAFTALFITPVKAEEAEQKEYFINLYFPCDSLVYDTKDYSYNSNNPLYVEFKLSAHLFTVSPWSYSVILDISPYITKTVSFSNFNTTSYNYAPSGNFVRLELSNGVKIPITKSQYDDFDRLTRFEVKNCTDINGNKDINNVSNRLLMVYSLDRVVPSLSWWQAESHSLYVRTEANDGLIPLFYNIGQQTIGSPSADPDILYKITVGAESNSVKPFLFSMFSTDTITENDLSNMTIKYFGGNKYITPNLIKTDFIKLSSGFFDSHKYSQINIYALEFYISKIDLQFFRNDTVSLSFKANDFLLSVKSNLDQKGGFKDCNITVTEMTVDFEELPPINEVTEKNKTPYWDKIKKSFKNIGSSVGGWFDEAKQDVKYGVGIIITLLSIYLLIIIFKKSKK